MTLKIPPSIQGRNPKEDYEGVIARAEKQILTPTPSIIAQTGDLTFITDEKLYKEIVKYMDRTFPEHKGVLSEKLAFDGVMKGSSSYIATATDMFLKSINAEQRIATQRDLETNLQMFKGFYEDTGLALRSVKDPNKDRAKYLYEQIRKRNPKIAFPIFVELRGLELNAELNFNLTEESRYKTAECLNWDSGTKYSQTDDFGLPKEKDKSSSRGIWRVKDGLVRFFLDGNLSSGSSIDDLGISGDDGRVVLGKLNSGGIK